MTWVDTLKLLHPFLAVGMVFPILGLVASLAWQTRQRRLQTVAGVKSKIPPVVGADHVRIGKVLTGAVVGICLLGITRPSVGYILKNKLVTQAPFQVVFLLLMLAATIACLVCLYRAREGQWRGIFAGLSSLGVIILGFQDLVLGRTGFGAIFRRDNEWYLSHFYFGTLVTILMIVSLAIIQEIYQDRSQAWRKVHIALNCLALVLFVGQAMTGTRDLLEIPLSWQEPFVYSCDFVNLTCPTPPPPP